MAIKSMDLAWIVVEDIKKAVKYYTETLGLELKVFVEEMGWAELQGAEGGALLGLVQAQEDMKPGTNAVMTFTVDDLEKTLKELSLKNIKMIGTIQEVPGHVKLQMGVDASGNQFQLVQDLSQSQV